MRNKILLLILLATVALTASATLLTWDAVPAQTPPLQFKVYEAVPGATNFSVIGIVSTNLFAVPPTNDVRGAVFAVSAFTLADQSDESLLSNTVTNSFQMPPTGVKISRDVNINVNINVH